MTERILLVDDNVEIATLLRDALRRRGFETDAVESAEAALAGEVTRALEQRDERHGADPA